VDAMALLDALDGRELDAGVSRLRNCSPPWWAKTSTAMADEGVHAAGLWMPGLLRFFRYLRDPASPL
jgi:hypothetical protein